MCERVVLEEVGKAAGGGVSDMEGVKGGWRNHQAARAWEGHECALAVYCNAMIREWIKRGYRNKMEFPWWWGWMPVHMFLRKYSSHIYI
jgi:hypothetical protein